MHTELYVDHFSIMIDVGENQGTKKMCKVSRNQVKYIYLLFRFQDYFYQLSSKQTYKFHPELSLILCEFALTTHQTTMMSMLRDEAPFSIINSNFLSRAFPSPFISHPSLHVPLDGSEIKQLISISYIKVNCPLGLWASAGAILVHGPLYYLFIVNQGFIRKKKKKTK